MCHKDVCVWEGGKLFTCPYPLKVQARPLRDCRPAIQSKVLGQGVCII